ncbi:hypothetical protein [Neorhizobium sp. JUb45]|uniref:hypothetical protein n=1 Tax=unclassified Neorhizobium TaxID=2629175 RepID=UPI001043B9B9|nr:hypothetical protein [Neorhizobium sp. JUb45]TCR07151.1 hypothetical protein EDF70_1011118 [Neorhizobium sp. JUb45]
MSTSLFKNPRALLGGAAVAVVVFFASALLIGGGSAPAAPQPGSVQVRAITKDNGVKNVTMSVVLALVGGFFAARAIHRRGSAKA